jgi:hypothetical protein
MSEGEADRKRMTKMAAGLEQIEAAIEHFHVRQYACSITLAGAAEDQIERTDDDHLWERLRQQVPEGAKVKSWLAVFNETRNWLKHPAPQLANERYIEEYDCVFMLLRAISKFSAHYVRTSEAMDTFTKWCKTHNYIIQNKVDE